MSLLDCHGYNVNFGSKKVIISRYGQFVGNSFLLDDLYRLSIIPSSSNTIFYSQLSVANIECCDTRHGRLGQVNKNTIKKMMYLDLIPKSPVDLNDRC